MEQIKYYMAPMEGVTGYVFRNAYAKYYGGIERYFTPFVANKKLGHREKNDVCPEHNAGMTVIPQILTNHAEDFLAIAEILREYRVRYGQPEPWLPVGHGGGKRTRRRISCDAGRAGSFSGRDF